MKLQKIKRISNKKVTTRDRKQKSNKTRIISLQYKHNFRRLKSTLKNKIQESWISHPRLAIHGPYIANYTLVFFVGYGHFCVFTYWGWSLQSLACCFARWFSLLLTFLSFSWWQLYCLVLRWRHGTTSKGMCRLLPFLEYHQTFGMFLETISASLSRNEK